MAYKFSYTTEETQQLFQKADDGYNTDSSTLEMAGNIIGIKLDWLDASIRAYFDEREPGWDSSEKYSSSSNRSNIQNVYIGNILLSSSPEHPEDVANVVSDSIVYQNFHNGNLKEISFDDVYTTSLNDVKSVSGIPGENNYLTVLIPDNIKNVGGGIVGFGHSYIADISESESEHSILIKGNEIEFEGLKYRMYAEYRQNSQAVDEITIADSSIMKSMKW